MVLLLRLHKAETEASCSLTLFFPSLNSNTDSLVRLVPFMHFNFSINFSPSLGFPSKVACRREEPGRASAVHTQDQAVTSKLFAWI